MTTGERSVLAHAAEQARRDIEAAHERAGAEGHAYAFGYAWKSLEQAAERIEVALRLNDEKSAA